MLDSLITSKTRLKLMMKFFINSDTTAYLRNLAVEFGESTNGIRQELNRFEDAQLLQSEMVQNKKIYRANIQHPYYADMHQLLLKYIGIDQLVENVVKRIGHLDAAFVINDFAQGNPGKLMELVFVGDNLDQQYLVQLVHKAEENVSFKIHYLITSKERLPLFLPDPGKTLLIWKKEALS